MTPPYTRLRCRWASSIAGSPARLSATTEPSLSFRSRAPGSALAPGALCWVDFEDVEFPQLDDRGALCDEVIGWGSGTEQL